MQKLLRFCAFRSVSDGVQPSVTGLPTTCVGVNARKIPVVHGRPSCSAVDRASICFCCCCPYTICTTSSTCARHMRQAWLRLGSASGRHAKCAATVCHVWGSGFFGGCRGRMCLGRSLASQGAGNWARHASVTSGFPISRDRSCPCMSAGTRVRMNSRR